MAGRTRQGKIWRNEEVTSVQTIPAENSRLSEGSDVEKTEIWFWMRIIVGCSALQQALYTYEDDNNDLVLAGSGGGGLAEIALTFDSTRVMYGFCSLKEPNAALPRYILINWVSHGGG
ncbi:drebrin-like protein [Oryzias melastigma]|uniref:drebrin-like protein n=1 Tax=Oryzias melastigma TaxID=30732 RepID=UPI00168D3CD3|nr:drebrin-like protein [Oryzias melastigma]